MVSNRKRIPTTRLKRVNSGKLARIGTNKLITCDIELVTRMNAPRSEYKRSEWYLGFRLAPGIDNVGSLRDEKEHTKRRAQMSPGVCPPPQNLQWINLEIDVL